MKHTTIIGLSTGKHVVTSTQVDEVFSYIFAAANDQYAMPGTDGFIFVEKTPPATDPADQIAVRARDIVTIHRGGPLA